MIESPRLDSSESLPTQRVQGPTLLLTPKEREVLVLYGHGLFQEEIAAKLHIKIPTVKNHTTNLSHKLLENSAHYCVIRALISGQIGIEKVLPEWHEQELLNDLTAEERDIWANLAQRVGTTEEIAKIIGKGKSKVKKHAIDIKRKLGLVKRVELSVIFYAEHPELVKPHAAKLDRKRSSNRTNKLTL